MPPDAPTGLVPVVTMGDGNCFPRSISRAIFGNESRHREIRAHIVAEGIRNKELYLDNNYLTHGTTHIHQWGTFPQQYVMFSGQFIPPAGNLDDLMGVIYDKEMFEICKEGTYMGMWQLWAASNIIGRPIQSIFPERGSKQFRCDFNRLVVPHDTRKRNWPPLNIIWTPVSLNGQIIHFVPLLQKK